MPMLGASKHISCATDFKVFHRNLKPEPKSENSRIALKRFSATSVSILSLRYNKNA